MWRNLNTLDNKRRRILLTLGAALTVASIGVGATSLAVFTDTETVDATFTSGTIILDATKVDALNLSVGGNWVPGDSVTGSVDVENDGTNELRYSLNTTSTSVAGPNGGMLNGALTVEVRPIDATTPVTKCNDFDGVPVLQAAEVLGASNVMFGSVSPTVGTGDVTVAAGATHVLCIRVSLPLATGDTFQGAGTVTTFTFNAEQTQNN
jgi:predicted ribosomally synthesized peptide with SipW-like signal peptide